MRILYLKKWQKLKLLSQQLKVGLLGTLKRRNLRLSKRQRNPKPSHTWTTCDCRFSQNIQFFQNFLCGKDNDPRQPELQFLQQPLLSWAGAFHPNAWPFHDPILVIVGNLPSKCALKLQTFVLFMIQCCQAVSYPCCQKLACLPCVGEDDEGQVKFKIYIYKTF